MMEIKDEIIALFEYGYQQRMSDIYLLPQLEDYLLIGRMHERIQMLSRLSKDRAEQYLIYLKFQANMDVGEKRRPQLGAFRQTISHDNLYLRLSTVSNYRQQESLVIRFLYHSQNQKQMYYVNPTQLNVLRELIQKRGLHLFSGPVGSGKTTLMYHLAKNMARHHHVMTIEDPVEMDEPNFLQLQVQPKIQCDYDELIKLALRHRPDCLIIGEIRDEKTASYAMRAALTGHTVLATIHGQSVHGIRRRLIDLGVRPIDIDQGIASVTYQRLLPVYCPVCHFEENRYCPNQHKHYRSLIDTVEFSYQEGKWNYELRRLWALGIIDELCFQKEQTSDLCCSDSTSIVDG